MINTVRILMLTAALLSTSPSFSRELSKFDSIILGSRDGAASLTVDRVTRQQEVVIQRGFSYAQSMCFTEKFAIIRSQPKREQKSWKLTIDNVQNYIEFKIVEDGVSIYRCEDSYLKTYFDEDGWSKVSYKEMGWD